MKRFLQTTLCLIGMALPVAAQDLTETLHDAYDAGALPGLHGAVVDLDGTQLGAAYFTGADERWGTPLGDVAHGPDVLHDLRSVTKSITGLLYGIALADGLVPPLDTPLYEALPGYAHLATPDHMQIRIADVLSMRMGLEWNEDLPYTDPANSEIAMERAEDRYAYILSRAVVAEPGTRWTYSGGATALIGKLIADGSGQTLDDFARERLFTPLGISNFDWVKGADGIPSAASGLRMTLPDLARIGQLLAARGAWDGTQIIPQSWIEQSLTPQVSLSPHVQYGLHWYISGTKEKVVAFAAGNGGQRLTVQMDVRLVVASFAGRYNDPGAWETGFNVFAQYAIPAARKALGKE